MNDFCDIDPLAAASLRIKTNILRGISLVALIHISIVKNFDFI
jgi:hypothetical protein